MSASAQRAEIAAATAAARAEAQARINAQARQLRQVLNALAQDIRLQLAQYASADGTINVAQIPAIQQYLDGRLGAFLQRYHGLLDDGLVTAAVVGSVALPLIAEHVPQSSVVQDVLQFVKDYRAADGLKLSDRIWRVSNQTSDTISQAIQNAIARGQTAAQAAREYIAQGLPIPGEISAEMAAAQFGNVSRTVIDSLINPDAIGNPAYNLERVLRTEMNRAYTQAYVSTASQHEDFAGVKFNLSPNHPRTDICDLYANANLYGLGPGVYPVGQSPWPAHPNTLSYLTTIYTDQVTQDDTDGQATWQDWLGGQTAGDQDAMLGSMDKGAAFRAGKLDHGDLLRPWKDISGRIEGST